MINMNMKDKKTNKIRLGTEGGLQIDVVKADLASASNGTAAQPAGPLTAVESTVQVPAVSFTKAEDPNAQKETTVQPDLTGAVVVGATEELLPVKKEVK